MCAHSLLNTTLLYQCIFSSYLDYHISAFCPVTTIQCHCILCSPAEHHKARSRGAAEGVRPFSEAAVADVTDTAAATGCGDAPDWPAALLQLHAQQQVSQSVCLSDCWLGCLLAQLSDLQSVCVSGCCLVCQMAELSHLQSVCVSDCWFVCQLAELSDLQSAYLSDCWFVCQLAVSLVVGWFTGWVV